MESLKNLLLLFFVEVWEITVPAETQTTLRGLGATSLVQMGRSRDSYALLTHAQVGTSCKKQKQKKKSRCWWKMMKFLHLPKYSSTEKYAENLNRAVGIYSFSLVVSKEAIVLI